TAEKKCAQRNFKYFADTCFRSSHSRQCTRYRRYAHSHCPLFYNFNHVPTPTISIVAVVTIDSTIKLESIAMSTLKESCTAPNSSDSGDIPMTSAAVCAILSDKSHRIHSAKAGKSVSDMAITA